LKKYDLSIIIPTYNREKILKKTINLLESQEVKKKFEIIVVDDGSTDETENSIKKLKQEYNNLVYLFQKNKGPAYARNKGLDYAKGEYILFMGDDTKPSDRKYLEKQFNFLKEFPDDASLGLTLWDQKFSKNKFMQFLCPNGPQFNYSRLKKGDLCGWGRFWTSNIILKRKWFESEKFDLGFKYAAYEDVELGYRLQKKGLKIRFNPDAKLYHDHFYTLEMFKNRQVIVGKALKYFLKKWPELKGDLIPKKIFLKRLIIYIYENIGFIQRISFVRNSYYSSISSIYILQGFENTYHHMFVLEKE